MFIKGGEEFLLISSPEVGFRLWLHVEALVHSWEGSFLSVEGGGLLLDHPGLYETSPRGVGTGVNDMCFGPINTVASRVGMLG